MLKRKQRGVALITAIFVVTLAAIAAAALVEVASVSAHRSANLVLSETEWWYANGIESWVKGILMADAKITQGNTVGLNGIWAKPVDFLPIDGGGIRGHIDDLQGRFNLNNLAVNTPAGSNGETIYTLQFERLLENLPNFDASKYRGISAAIRDWVDADDQRSGTDGAEDQDYQSQDPPYRAANQGMHSVSELLLVRGMSKELYAALLPYVTVLPVTTQVNVNTAPLPVLLSLSSNIDQPALEKFVAARTKQPASSNSDVSGSGSYAFIPPPQTQPGQPPAQAIPIAVTSSYFGLQAEVFVGSGRLALYSVIQRPGAGSPVILAHSTNTQ